MPFFRFTKRAAVLLFPLFCTEPFLAQERPPHACFEQPNGAKDAIRRLPESARYWLAEDAIYFITPEERCAFLRLQNDPEREQFIEQFWYRRSVDPISLDYDFQTEFYRRIVFANEKYGSKLLAGRNTDRGRLYVIFGQPESVDGNSDRSKGEAAPHSIESWHYHYIKGIGENVQIHDVRFNLGLVRYHVGAESASHDYYMRELGVQERWHYPGFSEDPKEAFLGLAHDLAFADDFLHLHWCLVAAGGKEGVIG